jgi:hypothetical protein
MTSAHKQRRILSPVADTREVPDASALRGKFESQLVFGEDFLVEEESGDWCRGTCSHDGYAGWIEAKHLGDSLPPSTHIVTATRTHVYRDASIKSPLLTTLSFGSRVSSNLSDEKFLCLEGGGWIYAQHLSPISSVEPDYVATALKFIETPYLWGGRSAFGIDCSGLVQVAFARASIKTARDTEEQFATIGTPVATPVRGDIIFFKGHVGIMTDEKDILHANAFHMKVTIEPLNTVANRSGGILAMKRL